MYNRVNLHCIVLEWLSRFMHLVEDLEDDLNLFEHVSVGVAAFKAFDGLPPSSFL